MDFYIFRHGQTYFSKNDIPYGNNVKTAEIETEGIPAIKRLAKYLKGKKTEANFTSPFKRCLQTSSIVTDITGKEFEIDENLRDWDPESESVQDMIKRIIKFCQKIVEKNYNAISICTHGYPINAVTSYFIKGSIREKDLENFPATGTLVKVKKGQVSYKDFN